MAAVASKQAYSRAEACRLLKLTEKQLTSWEHQKLIPPREHYGFKDLLALRAIIKLRQAHRPVTQIGRAVGALTAKLRHVTDPLTQLKLYTDGKRIRVEVEGGTMEAESGQLLLNFDEVELSRLLEFRAPDSAAADRERRLTADRWFQRGLEMEQEGAPHQEVIDAYTKAIELDPHAAGAMVNLGTLHFNARNWREAERFYRQALDADPDYPLAHFDLANLYDERGDRTRAVEHYVEALRISPQYADAHYNIALLYQGSNQPMKAVKHWTTYLKLDPASTWANVARRELAKLRDRTVVPGFRGN
ncbi:MAG: tetratricopeptide repeat protein [Acidobacteriota bacterium]